MGTINAYITELQYGYVQITEDDIAEHNDENDTGYDINNLSEDEIKNIIVALYHQGMVKWHESEITDIQIEK